MGKRKSKLNPNHRLQASTASAALTPVLYIHPAKQGLDFRVDKDFGRPYGLIPVGLPALVNVLRAQGIAVRGVSHALELQFDHDFALKRWLKQNDSARVVLIDLHWYEHCYGAVEAARAVKETLPTAWTVLGGLSASGFANEILRDFSEVDFIIRGDAEKPLLELVKLLLANPGAEALAESLGRIPNLSYRSAGEVVENLLGYTAGTADLDTLDFVHLDFLDHSREYLVHEYIVADLGMARTALEKNPFRGRWLLTARGCKYHCSYCGGSKESHKLLAGRSGIIVRSPEKVVDDLAMLQEMGVHQASMSYDIAELGEEYWRTLFSGMRQRKIKIGLYNEFFQIPSPAFIDDLAHSADLTHSCVAVSALSGTERVRRLNGKHYSNAQLFEILDALQRHQFYIFVYFSLNLPGETTKSFENTLHLAQNIYQFYPKQRLKMLNTVHTIDPVSPMNMYADKFGVVATMKTFGDFYEYCRLTQRADPAARTGLHRGFHFNDPNAQSLETMADAWDQARVGREISWWPIPPSW
jgi:radical SAM superfamily enzyme YgiQ (UPF0313 family)